ncbi:HypC/HybG/HupF family hydrogenase formation chaperone [Xylanimonas ulmi]|uniref:Hydrogenase maturation protein HypC n=1 Tax=Xylanimonas ulmi TaxID=228973 RepID=A0A4Q7M4E4_9MICO|nr:HypC/HybG/HupF family hydrogenase formation chaperone [Xylanibacterium ulmi]RZS62816.1 hydrogenase maturation protein HypC [Xylanibacterium ulmi]
MCVAIPARIEEITPGPLPTARLDVAGRSASCCLAYLPQAAVGDYVLVQNGFAVLLLDPLSAAESLAAFADLGLWDGLGDGLLDAPG